VAHGRYDPDGHKPAQPDAVPGEQPEREHGGNDRSADVDRKHRGRPFRHRRNDVLHAVEGNHLPGDNLAFRQLSDRNVDVAANQRGKQQQQYKARVDADALVGIAQRGHFDECDEHDKRCHQNGKERQRERQVVELVHLRHSRVSA